jgi:hypothetical protein
MWLTAVIRSEKLAIPPQPQKTMILDEMKFEEFAINLFSSDILKI